jgi:hypothetical protein
VVDIDGGAVYAVLGSVLVGNVEGLVGWRHPAGGHGGGFHAEGFFDYGCGVWHERVGAEEGFDGVLVVYWPEQFVMFGAKGFKIASVPGQGKIVKYPL